MLALGSAGTRGGVGGDDRGGGLGGGSGGVGVYGIDSRGGIQGVCGIRIAADGYIKRYSCKACPALIPSNLSTKKTWGAIPTGLRHT